MKIIKFIGVIYLLLFLTSGCINQSEKGLHVCEAYDVLDRKYEVFLEYENYKIIKRTEVKTYPKELIQGNESLFEEEMIKENKNWKLHGVTHHWEFNNEGELIETLIIDYLAVNEIWLKTNGYEITIKDAIRNFEKNYWHCYKYQEYDLDRV